MPRRRTALAWLSCLLPGLGLGGCCSLARLFCGPDDSRWVTIAYDTPTATLRTLLEAMRRNAPEVVYECLSSDFRSRNGVGQFDFQIAWERLREQVPGLHLVGYAEVPAPEFADGGATFVLDVEGHAVKVDLVQESFVELEYRRPQGTLGYSSQVVTSFNRWARVERIDDDEVDRSRLVLLEPIEFEHEGFGEIPLADIERAGLVRRWKVDSLRQLEQ